MIFIDFNYHSKALSRRVAVDVLLPQIGKKDDDSEILDVGPYKTLYLFHGLSGNHKDWMRFSAIERYAEKYNLAVVMPDVGRSWYTDTAYGSKYFTFVSKELPEVCRGYFKGMSEKKEDNFVGGLSMGGYGALKVALTLNENYAGCISLSGALDITRKNRPINLEEWKSIFNFNMVSADELEGSEHDLYALVRKNHELGIEFPKMYIWCGTEDSPALFQNNRDFHQLLNELNIQHYYQESEGNHSWKWWDLHIQNALQYMFG